MSFTCIFLPCGVSVLNRTLIILVQDKKNYIAKITCGCFPTSTRKFTSHMVLSIIFLEDKNTSLLHLSIFYEYQQFFQHRICFSIQPDYSDPWPRLARSSSFFVIMLFNNMRQVLPVVPAKYNPHDLITVVWILVINREK